MKTTTALRTGPGGQLQIELTSFVSSPDDFSTYFALVQGSGENSFVELLDSLVVASTMARRF